MHNQKQYDYIFFFLCEEQGRRVEKSQNLSLSFEYFKDLTRGRVEEILESCGYKNPEITDYIQVFQSSQEVVDHILKKKETIAHVILVIEGKPYEFPVSEFTVNFDNSLTEEEWPGVIGTSDMYRKLNPELPEIKLTLNLKKNDFLVRFAETQKFVENTEYEYKKRKEDSKRNLLDNQSSE